MNIYTHGFLVTSQKDVCTFAPCLSTSVGTARLTGKNVAFSKNVLGLDLGVNFPPGKRGNPPGII